MQAKQRSVFALASGALVCAVLSQALMTKWWWLRWHRVPRHASRPTAFPSKSNQLQPLDGHALVDLHASSAINEHFEVFAHVSNLFDTDYANFGLIGGAPDEVLPGLADQGSILIGAGAPRAAWIDVRLRL